jgi:hypothetical protein
MMFVGTRPETWSGEREQRKSRTQCSKKSMRPCGKLRMASFLLTKYSIDDVASSQGGGSSVTD